MNLIDLTGKKFTRLTVIGLDRSEKKSNGSVVFWKCQCSCGASVSVRSESLRKGTTKSCGCYRKDEPRLRCTTHGQTGSATYRAWQNMKKRCLNPATTGYERWGGRGIKVCDEWLNDFDAFLRDMGPCPKGMMLDRYPNNDGNYEPHNCRWATRSEQMRNKRDNVHLTIAGETMCVAAWAKRVGRSHKFIHKRLRLGWDSKRAVFAPNTPGYPR